MIEYINGDILVPANNNGRTVVCHQVNLLGVMGAGLALQIKKAHPETYDKYKRYCESGKAKLGDVAYTPSARGEGYYIANCFSQSKISRNSNVTDYDAFRECMRRIRKDCEMWQEPWTVRIPYKMGCGIAGGDWSIVLKIIEDVFSESKLNIEIWRLDV